MNTTFRILDALNQGAPKPAIIKAIAEAGIKCICQTFHDEWISENVFMMDANYKMPPDCEEYPIKSLTKADIAFLVDGGTILYNANTDTYKTEELYRIK